MKKLRSSVLKVINFLSNASDFIAGLMVLILLVNIFSTVVLRYVFSVSPAWFSDLAKLLLIWVVYIGAVSVSRNGTHIMVDLLLMVLSAKSKAVLKAVINLALILMSLVVTVIAYQETIKSMHLGQNTASAAFPLYIGFAAVAVGFFLMALGNLGSLLDSGTTKKLSL